MIIFRSCFQYFHFRKNHRFDCPIEGCMKKSLANLPRHLMENIDGHKWPYEKATAAVNRLNLRKQYEFKSGKLKSKKARIRKICPLPNCLKVAGRIDEHLKSKKHQDDITSTEHFRHLCNIAEEFKFQTLPKSPSKIFSSQKHDVPVSSSRKPSLVTKKTIQPSQSSSTATSMSLSKATPMYSSTSQDPELDTTIFTEASSIPFNTREQPNVSEHPNIPLSPSHSPTLLSNYSSSDHEDNNDVDCYSDNTDIYESDDEVDNTCSKNLPEEMENTLQKFHQYLIGPDVNRHSNSCKQVIGDFRRILKAVSATTISEIFKENFLRDKYLFEYCREKRFTAETQKKYLRTVIDFLKFQIAEKELVDVTTEESMRMTVLVKGWIKRQTRDSQTQGWERMERNYENLVDGDQVRQYEKSENAVTARKVFQGLKDNQSITINRDVFVTTRDHLFVKIHFGNGNRSGVTANMTVTEFNNAKYIEPYYVIQVRNHKTYHSNGPAMLTLTQEQHEWMKLFLTHVRKIAIPRVDNFFIAYTGEAMRPGAVSNQLNSLWKKAGIQNTNSRLCGNLVRKSVVTGVRDKNLGNLQEVADNMSHSLKTAENHYHLRNKQKSAVIAGGTIRELYSEVSPSKERQCTTPQKKVWKEEEIDILKETFDADQHNSSISVRDNCTKDNLCERINASPKQIFDKLKSMKRYSPSGNGVSRTLFVLP